MKETALVRLAAYVVLAILIVGASIAAVLNIQEGMAKPTFAIITALMTLGLLRLLIERPGAKGPYRNRWMSLARNFGWGLASITVAIGIMWAYAAGYLR